MWKIKALLLFFMFSFNVNARLSEAPNWSIEKEQQVISAVGMKGKPYVLHFWATWCPYCKRVQPGIDNIATEYQTNGIDTFAVSFWENSNADPEREMQNRGLSLNVLANGDDVAKAFGVQGTPTTVFVDHNGQVLVRLTTSNPNDPQLKSAYEALSDRMAAEK